MQQNMPWPCCSIQPGTSGTLVPSPQQASTWLQLVVIWGIQQDVLVAVRDGVVNAAGTGAGVAGGQPQDCSVVEHEQDLPKGPPRQLWEGLNVQLGTCKHALSPSN